MKIYHNPRCRKSRESLSILYEHNIKVNVIEYLKTPLTRTEIEGLIKMLSISPLELVRKNEKLFKEVYKNKQLTDDEWIDVLCAHPILIERPIIVKDNFAVLGRPPINVLDLLNR